MVTDWTGHRKIYIIGQWDWNVSPFIRETDKFSIGYPDNAGFYFRTTSSGGIAGHRNVVQRQGHDGVWVTDPTIYVPSNWEPGIGVAGKIKLTDHTDDHKGYMQQDVYVGENSSGTTNIKLRYGHSILGFEPSVGVYPVGLAITPSTTVETLDYALTVSW